MSDKHTPREREHTTCATPARRATEQPAADKPLIVPQDRALATAARLVARNTELMRRLA